MFAKPINKKREKLKRIVHIIVGFTILLHAYEYYENADQTYLLFLFAGIFFLTIAVFHPFLEKKALGLTVYFLQLKVFFTL